MQKYLHEKKINFEINKTIFLNLKLFFGLIGIRNRESDTLPSFPFALFSFASFLVCSLALFFYLTIF